MRRRNEIFHTAALTSFVIGSFFFPALFLNTRSLQWDALDLHYPHLAFFSRAIQTGIVPLWEPHIFCGYPFAGYLQSGSWYPLNFVTSLLTPITPRIVMLLVIAAYAVAFGGMRCLARFLGLSRAAALMAAIAWVLSGPMLSHASHVGIIQLYAAFPWVLLIASHSWKSGSFRPMALSGIVLGWSILAGHFQSALYCFVFWLLWLLPAMHPRRSESAVTREQPSHRLMRVGGSIVLSALLVALATGIQLPATADLALQSQRSSLSSSLAQSENLYPGSLLTLIAPDFEGGIGGNYSGPWDRTNQQCFAGFATPLLWIAGVFAGVFALRKSRVDTIRSQSTPSGDRRPIYPATGPLFLALFGVFSILFALGPITPVHEWTIRIIPAWNLVRTPSAILPLGYLALALLAGMGLDWMTANTSHRLRLIIGFGFPALSFVHLTILYANSDLMFGKTHPYTHFQSTSHRDFLDERYADDPAGFRIHEWDIREVMLTNEASWKGWYSTGGRISGLHPRNLGALLRMAEFNRDILDILRVRYVLVGSKATAAFVVSTSTPPVGAKSWDPRKDLEEVAPGIRFNPLAKGIAFPVTEWEIIEDGRKIMDRLPEIDLNRRVILEENPTGSYDAEVERWTVTLLHNDLHLVEFTCFTDQPAILVMGDSWTADWKATIDGNPVRLLRADLALRAVETDAGFHTIRLEYSPTSYRIGLFGWLIGFGVFAWLLISFPSSNSSQKCHKPGS